MMNDDVRKNIHYSYNQKIKHYQRENLLAQSLCKSTYESNPNFLNMKKSLKLPFKHHDDFKKADLKERQALYQAICEKIWGVPIGK